MSSQFIDISPLVSVRSPVFPGDQAFSRKVSLDFTLGHHLALSSMTSTLHIGAHADAPSHYHPEGRSIEQVSLDLYCGPCQVIDCRSQGAKRLQLTPEQIASIRAPRVLFRTDSFTHEGEFQTRFASLSPELIQALALRGVILVGIDSPSVDPADSKDLPSHQALYAHAIAVLEGLDLRHTEERVYELIALPLRLEGGDASPVRAVLRL